MRSKIIFSDDEGIHRNRVKNTDLILKWKRGRSIYISSIFLNLWRELRNRQYKKVETRN